METETTRRRAVLMMGTVGVAGALAAGCQAYGRPEPAAPAAPSPAPDATGDGADGGNATPDGGGDGEDNGDGGDAPAGGTPVAAAGDVPVGGGVVLSEQELVVTQPSAGEFVGFSAICTHQGCTVADVADGTINCPCHASRFSIVDGSVVQPASTLPAGATQDPLPQVPIIVEGDTIALP